jgi:hypothetical protein
LPLALSTSPQTAVMPERFCRASSPTIDNWR